MARNKSPNRSKFFIKYVSLILIWNISGAEPQEGRRQAGMIGFEGVLLNNRNRAGHIHFERGGVLGNQSLLAGGSGAWLGWTAMSDHIYKKIELVGTSPESIEEAVNNAVAKAGKSVHNMRWLEVVETRGHIEDNKVAHWQVTVKIGFTLDE
jgi:flavin-binding protein dodecin